MSNIIRDIFYGNELTWHGKDSFTLNKWCLKKQPYEIPKEIAITLINDGWLEHDSGNFETKEEHYTYNTFKTTEFEFYIEHNKEILDKLIPILRDIKLNKLLNYK